MNQENECVYARLLENIKLRKKTYMTHPKKAFKIYLIAEVRTQVT